MLLAEAVARYGHRADHLPARFFKAQARFLSEPWMMSTDMDFRYPTTVGRRPKESRLIKWYTQAIFAALEDPAHAEALARAVLSVNYMLEPQSSLLRPNVVARVLGSALGRLRRPVARRPFTPFPELG